MLQSEPKIQTTNRELIELQEGVYVSEFSFSLDYVLSKSNGYISNPMLSDDNWYYGVCDNIENLLQVMPELTESDRTFVVLLTQITKADQPDIMGWRWHKWGDYIGNEHPTAEYLYDELVIDLVYVYSIYEKVND